MESIFSIIFAYERVATGDDYLADSAVAAATTTAANTIIDAIVIVALCEQAHIDRLSGQTNMYKYGH